MVAVPAAREPSAGAGASSSASAASSTATSADASGAGTADVSSGPGGGGIGISGSGIGQWQRMAGGYMATGGSESTVVRRGAASCALWKNLLVVLHRPCATQQIGQKD